MSELRCFNPLPTSAEDRLPSAAKHNPNVDGRACGRHGPMAIQRLALMERKRGAIVAAARQTFLENGYGQASMDRIAESATVSVKTIYRHFKNKDELFSAHLVHERRR
jgi:AcrR family transcriptional regulator